MNKRDGAGPILYDVAAGRVVASRERVSGTVNQMSFRRLAELLRRSGEVSAHEILTHIEVSHDGLTLRYEIKRDAG